MSGYNQALICAIAVLFGVFTFDLLRRRRLNVEYGLLWLVLAVGVLGVVGWKWLLFRMTFWMGARQPASILTLLSLAFIFFFLAFLTVQLSTVSSRIKHLTQVVALLEHEVREMKEKQNGTAEDAKETIEKRGNGEAGKTSPSPNPPPSPSGREGGGSRPHGSDRLGGG